MCGIAGIYSPQGVSETDKQAIYPMTSILAHRGPDGQGVYTSETTLLGHRRLSIIDLTGGKQPMSNEDGSIWIVFNGEIFNYLELMEMLKLKGHRFSTRSDTEVLLHLYEEYGTGMFTYCNGQFAIGLWDSNCKKCILARDRVGIQPLFFTRLSKKKIVFSSEMKSIFCHGSLPPEIDPAGLDQIFTLWVNIPPQTVFKGIEELPPGCFMEFDHEGGTTIHQYWNLEFPSNNEYEHHTLEYYSRRLREMLCDATEIRLRADVPVAAYLSGGVDSSVISAIVKKYHVNNLITFSVVFKDNQFDESEYQAEMVRHLHTDHRVIEADYTNIGNAFSDVVWYAEKPMIRTAPSPLFLLSGLVKSNGIKVVLTGEGADEMLGGYDIFKEALIRRFWARQPHSLIRPQLFSRIYSDVVRNSSADLIWQRFFKFRLTDTAHPYYSHLIRWNNTSPIKALFNRTFQDLFNEEVNVVRHLRRYLNPCMTHWHSLCKAQYLEIKLFLSGYLLSSQGDRMMMGNSIEGRFPFLDHRVIEFAAKIPPVYKMMGLNEKFILKHAFRDLVPTKIINRPKQPYRAPINQCFLEKNKTSELLTPDALEAFGYFDPARVKRLTDKMVDKKVSLSERENMAVVAVASTQLLHEHFVRRDWKRERTMFSKLPCGEFSERE